MKIMRFIIYVFFINSVSESLILKHLTHFVLFYFFSFSIWHNISDHLVINTRPWENLLVMSPSFFSILPQCVCGLISCKLYNLVLLDRFVVITGYFLRVLLSQFYPMDLIGLLQIGILCILSPNVINFKGLNLVNCKTT